MKEFIGKYKGFSIAVGFEILIIIFFLISCIGKPVSYTLDASNLSVIDQAVTYSEEKGSLYITGKNDAEPFGRWIIESAPLTLRPGMYEMKAVYNSYLYDLDNGEGNCDDYTGSIQIYSENNQSKIRYNELLLNDGMDDNMDSFYVRSLTNIADVQLKIVFNGMGELYLNRIEISELTDWRFIRFLGIILLFVFIDFCYIYFFTENNYANKKVIGGLIITIVFSSLPLLTDFLFYGHDINFHIERILSLAQGIQSGNWLNPIQTEMFNGHGYATPLFYSQLFLYIPAILHVLSVPLYMCYKVYVFLINIVTCFICYTSVKGITKNKEIAVAGAFLYTNSAYRIANIYIRAAVGEYTAMAFFPLIIYGFARIYVKEDKELNWLDGLPVVFGLTGLIQCHILSCELAGLFIFILCIILFKKTFRVKRFIILFATAIATLMLNLGFILPFLSSMTMNININYIVNQIEQQGTYIMQVFGMFMTSGGESVEKMQNEMPLTIGMSLTVGMILFLICCSKKYQWEIEKTDKELRIGKVCMGFAVASIVMSLKCIPWDSLNNINEFAAKVLEMVQFPWRYLAIATVFALFASVVALKIIDSCKGRKIMYISGGVMIAITIMTISLFYTEFGNTTDTLTVYSIPDKGGYAGFCEYLPKDTRDGDYNIRSIDTDYSVVQISDYIYENGVTNFQCSNISDKVQSVIVPLVKYNNYHAYDINNKELELTLGDNNRLGVVVPANYNGSIRIEYIIPKLWKISYMVSIITFIGIIVGVWYTGKLRKNVMLNIHCKN